MEKDSTERGPDPDLDVKINRFKLERECERQPSLYMFYSEELTDAKSDRDFEEDELDRILGKRELWIRDNPPEGTKTTENSVKASLSCDQEVVDQKEKFRKAKSRVYHLEGVTKSFEHRKTMLDNMVVLWSKGYYSLPDGGKMSSGTDGAELQARTGLNKKGDKA
jgi:hypothetical protein